MAKTQRTVVATAGVIAGLLGGGIPVTVEAGSRPIVIHVVNHAEVPAGTLADAQRRASDVFAAAGVFTAWVAEDPDTGSSDGAALHLRVLLLSPEMSERKISSGRLGDRVMGLAYRIAKRADILYPRIADLALKKGCQVSDVLGRVLAHEIGHLLLATGHSDRGIMQADLELRRGAPLRFTAAEVKSIHAELGAASGAN
jgi:hypothetical protein